LMKENIFDKSNETKLNHVLNPIINWLVVDLPL